MKFDLFVLPFLAGLNFILLFLIYKVAKWIIDLSIEDRIKLTKHIFSFSVFKSIKEIVSESLLHRKIFKTNPLLGYMHMSLAFGWFMIIVIGNFQVKIFSPDPINPPYYPIFLKYFEPHPPSFPFDRFFNFLMDMFLLLILSGVALAWYKRKNSAAFGMKKTTVHLRADRYAITALWFIFPLRFLAESLSSAVYNNGSFLTGFMGKVLGAVLPAEFFLYPSWWAYSLALGIFFMALPFSRYMHIPSEVILIIFRNAGVARERKMNVLANLELNSCSRCGICIDSCQLSGIQKNIQPSYFLRDLRYGTLKNETVQDCLMCGKCNVACPVGIESTNIRLAKRIENELPANQYSYLRETNSEKTEVLYFAGCMSHLTPSIKKSMQIILDTAGINWQMLDKDGTVCCGRPLLLAGQFSSAKALIEKNTSAIKASGAKLLVTSCPICFKAFKEEYDLDIEILHHSQYLERLIKENKISVNKSNIKVAYHDPCELGRGMGIFNEPRLVINSCANLVISPTLPEKGPCCGGSLGNVLITLDEKKEIALNALNETGIDNAQTLVTACPLCKKTFEMVTDINVQDISQLVVSQMRTFKIKNKTSDSEKRLEELSKIQVNILNIRE
jgi:Fe-S oxidoreductase